MKSPYENIDKRVKKLKNQNKSIIKRLSLKLSTFDESNIIRQKRLIHNAFETMKQNAIDEYLVSIKEIYPNADREMLLDWLDIVYIVTQYNFFNEIERREARYFEMTLALRQQGKKLNSLEMMQANRRTINSFNRQIEEFSIYVTDKALLEHALQESTDDNPMFKWHTEEDEKVCGFCRIRNGKKYRLDKIPIKHPSCRCWLELEK